MATNKLTPHDIREAIARIERVSTMPQMMTHMLTIIDDARSSAQDLEGVMARDPAVTANVLRVANSAFYGYSREVVTVADAAVLLGFEEVKRIVLAISVFDLMSSYDGGTFAREQVWLHALACGLGADLLQRDLHARLPYCYTAGLLHDLGKIVIDQYFPEHMQDIVQRVTTDDIPMIEAERRVLGLSHADIGYLLGKVWKFPAVLTDTLRFHHEPLRCKGSYVMTSIVHVGNHVANMLDNAKLHIGPEEVLDPNALHILNVEPQYVAGLADKVQERLQVFDSMSVGKP